MKKLMFIALALLLTGFSAFSQEEEEAPIWTKGGEGILTFANSSFGDYWSSGGQDNTNAGALLNLYRNKAKDDVVWDNNLRLEYGQSKIAGGDFEKSTDVIDLTSNYGKGIAESTVWYYSGIFNFLSQMTGTEVANNGDLIGLDGNPYGKTQSQLFGPADILLGLGVNYKPNEHFNSNLAPLTGKLTIIGDDLIANSQVYGNDLGKNSIGELGSSWITQYNNAFLTNDMLNFTTKLSLFSAYNNNPQNIDANFNTLTTLNPWKFITLTHSLDMMYDDDTRMTAFADGTPVLPDLGIGYTKQLQAKNYFGIGLTAKFGDSRDN